MTTFLIIYLIGYLFSFVILLSSIPNFKKVEDTVIPMMAFASLGSWITFIWIIYVLLND